MFPFILRGLQTREYHIATSFPSCVKGRRLFGGLFPCLLHVNCRIKPIESGDSFLRVRSVCSFTYAHENLNLMSVLFYKTQISSSVSQMNKCDDR
jgi:hypothetical protein